MNKTEAANTSIGGHVRRENSACQSTVCQRLSRIRDATDQAIKSSRDAMVEIRCLLDLENHLNRYPYRFVATAVGVGYILGGGLFSPATLRVLSAGVGLSIKLATLPVLQRSFATLVDTQTRESDGYDELSAPPDD